jgi:hypothetical protein
MWLAERDLQLGLMAVALGLPWDPTLQVPEEPMEVEQDFELELVALGLEWVSTEP